MDQRILERLELPRVLERLAALCATRPGHRLAAELAPSVEPEEVQGRLAETTEAGELLSKYPQLSVQGCRDIASLVDQASRGRMLTAEELLEVVGTLAVSRRLDEFFRGLPPASYPALRRWASHLRSFAPLEQAIGDAIDEEAHVRDTASARLEGLRRQQRRAEAQIREELEKIIHAARGQRILQDQVITMRQGRYVVPVKVECQQEMPGLVHDYSASGSTVFIEPAIVVQLNNKLRQLAAAEKEEIERLLQELSRLVGDQAAAILQAVTGLAHLDLALAKGKLSHDYNATAPAMAAVPLIDLRQARHPLLKHPVPQDISLGQDFATLIITGPNTGGKTVTLKAVGLLVAMHQCGLHIPVAAGSRLGIFQDIFVDIGDEQSIEQSLSTFSAHLANIAVILKRAGPGSLVLLDEVGAGTDPSQGAALAQALLEYLQIRGALTVATTHYGQLKVFAYHQPGVENACVEFDVETLQPTYRLCIGVPGQSHALEIAGRLGLPGEVVARTRQILGQPEQDLAGLISDFMERRREVEARQQELREEEAKLAARLARQEAAEARLAEQREKMVAEARAEARSIIRSTRAEAEHILKELRLEQAAAARQKIRALAGRVADPQVVPSGSPLAEIRAGQRVFVPRLGRDGDVISPGDHRGEVLVQLGNLRLAVPADELRPARRDASHETVQSPAVASSSKAREMASSLDLRGMTVDEALARVDKYLDDALLAGLSRVLIIHGRGTGALRGALQKYLRGHPQVQEYRLAADLGSMEVELGK